MTLHRRWYVRERECTIQSLLTTDCDGVEDLSLSAMRMYESHLRSSNTEV